MAALVLVCTTKCIQHWLGDTNVITPGNQWAVIVTLKRVTFVLVHFLLDEPYSLAGIQNK